jgi:cytochrome-b5 reductase
MVDTGPRRRRDYTLLVSSDELSETALHSLVDEQGLAAERSSLGPPEVQKGFSAGAAGGVTPLFVSSTVKLRDEQLASPVVSAALASVIYCDEDLLEAEDAATAGRAAACVLDASSWAAAVSLWREHTGRSGGRSSNEAVRFRVATLRGGRHSCTSKQIDGAIGEMLHDSLQPGWTVDMNTPELLVVVVIVQRRLLIGILLPPFRARASSVLPPEPRPWCVAGYDGGSTGCGGDGGNDYSHRPHMRPSRAAALLRLLFAPQTPPCSPLRPNGAVLLDPCGGIGILALEAARFARLESISMDLDPSAASAARQNAAAASAAGVLLGSLSVVTADAASAKGCSALRAGAVDAVVADLPYGVLHARMDVGRLLVELARVVRVGGRALLVGSAGSSGTARSCTKAAKRFTPGRWRVVTETACAAGGVACIAVLFERKEPDTAVTDT